MSIIKTITDRFAGRKPAREQVRRSLVLPDWMRRDETKLPSWAKRNDRQVVVSGKVGINIDVDTGAAYREWLALLGVADKDIDQYWLEVAYQCIKLDLQTALIGSEHDVRTASKPPQFKFLRAPEYEQAKFPKGLGVEAATKQPAAGQPDHRARIHYIRIRGRLP